MKSIVLCATTAALALSGSALADTCAAVSSKVAEQALAQLNIGTTVAEYLYYKLSDAEPEATPITIETVEVQELVLGEQTYSQIVINGQAVDLAYIYVPTLESKALVNLGALTDCTQDWFGASLPDVFRILRL